LPTATIWLILTGYLFPVTLAGTVTVVEALAGTVTVVEALAGTVAVTEAFTTAVGVGLTPGLGEIHPATSAMEIKTAIADNVTILLSIFSPLKSMPLVCAFSATNCLKYYNSYYLLLSGMSLASQSNEL
jgi:hypothetical protein